MKKVPNSVYTTFAREIEMNVTAYTQKDCVVHQMRNSIKNIAKCKAPKGSLVEICWNIEGECYTEIVKI